MTQRVPKHLHDATYAQRFHSHDALSPEGHGTIYTQVTRQILSGAGLTGGGDLTADRTLAVGAGTGITVNADDVALSAAVIASLALADTSVQPARQVISGGGLSGGGDLSADRTLVVGAGTGITVNADDVALDIAHARNVDHSGVTLTAGGGLTGGGDISASRTFTVGAGTGITVNIDDVALSAATITSLALADTAVQPARQVISGAGLTGGGDLSVDRTLAVGAGTGLAVNIDDVALSAASIASLGKADTAVQPARQVISGAGLTGGGDLSLDRTLVVGAGTGITVNADDVALDTTHARNVDHTAVVLTAGAGLTGTGDISASRTFAVGAGTGITVNIDDVALSAATITSLALADTSVQPARQIISGGGLTGGGDLSADRTLVVGAGTGITVNVDDVALDTAHARNVDHTAVVLTAGTGLTGGGDISASRSFAVGAGTGLAVNADDVALSAGSIASLALADTSVQPARQVISGGGLTGGGDLSIDRTIAVGAGTGIAVNADDVAISVDGVTNTLLANMAANTVKANATGATADPADLAVGANTVVGRAGGNIVAAQVATAQVADDAITYAKMQNVSATSRFLGRITAAAGNTEELTGTQATTLLDNFTSTLKGLAPLSGGGTSNFLRADGTWAEPAGAGASGANPTALVGLAAVNGVATTFLRSDGAPALDQGIAPMWSAIHTWSLASAAQAFNVSSNHASGPYTSYSRGGIPFGDIGNGAQMGGGYTLDSIAINARGTVLELGTSNTMRFRLTDGGLKLQGTFAANGATPAAAPDYTVTNPSTSRSLDVSAATLAQLNAVVGTIIADLIAIGLYQ